MACCKSFQHLELHVDIEDHHHVEADVELQEMTGLVEVVETHLDEQDDQACMKL